MHTPCVYINVMLPSVSILPICDGKVYPEIVSGAIYPFSVIVGNTTEREKEQVPFKIYLPSIFSCPLYINLIRGVLWEAAKAHSIIYGSVIIYCVTWRQEFTGPRFCISTMAGYR